jgi:hypothetical protein
MKGRLILLDARIINFPGLKLEILSSGRFKTAFSCFTLIHCALLPKTLMYIILCVKLVQYSSKSGQYCPILLKYKFDNTSLLRADIFIKYAVLS